MHKLLAFLVFPVLLLGPAVVLVAVTVLSAAARPASCGPMVTNVPGSLTATAADGVTVRLDGVQLAHAATIARVGSRTEGVGRDGVTVALMAALTESSLRMLANPTAYPDSVLYPNDGSGSDHDSLGLFQMRPVAGWGSVEELMDPGYQARAFFGGPQGPNGGSPRGLLDVPGWERMPKGSAAQAVEVSAFPDRYANFEPVADRILDALTTPGSAAHATEPGTTPTPDRPTEPAGAATSSPGGAVVFPLPEGTWRRTSGFGYRVHPVYATTTLHAGADYAAPAGTPVLAVADGIVTEVSADTRAGNLVVVDHQLDGAVATAYAHLLDGSTTVSVGDPVTAGQQVAAVGATGAATGPHLHTEVHPGGFWATTPIDPEPWLAGHDPSHLTQAAAAASAACTTGARP
ncbi:M23 family metallopeptidase [Myceligenerans crystallogenes]|uniref:M23ase beta-sheet core domain-containing protein n=1 Tax=Myceligenerans crystallogenes TaxID=316335 RepID=A0ABN2NL09_9MICO